MYTTKHFAAKIELPDYIRQYRDTATFITYCKACNRYNSCWSCPPFEFDTLEYMSPYKTAYIIGTQITPGKDTIENNRGVDKCIPATYRIIEEVRRILDNKLLLLEQQYPQSKAFFAGTCHLCPAGQCTRIKGRPCLHPGKIRPSLESFGFDIGKTTSELLNIEMKWSTGGLLPEYFTLVSGFFTQNTIPRFISFLE